MLPAEKASVFGRQRPSFLDFERQVRLRMQMANMEPSKTAAAPVLHTNSTARRVCLAAAGDHLATNDGLERIADTSSNYFGLKQWIRYTRWWSAPCDFLGRAKPSTGILWNLIYYDAKLNPICKWVWDTPRPSPPHYGCRTRRFRARKSRRGWPAHAGAWPSWMLRWPCEDYLDPAAARPVEIFWRRRTWASPAEVTRTQKRAQRTE